MPQRLYFCPPMKVLYNISIFLVGIGLRIASIFNTKAREFVTGRAHIFEKMREALRGNDQHHR